MTIYFIRHGTAGPVKIGYATDIKQRMKNLQGGAPEDLILLRTIPGGRKVEAWLHKHFDHLRLRREWFVFVGDMLTIVPPLLGPEANPKVEVRCKKLADYLHRNRLSKEQFGKKIGCTGRAVHHWIKGHVIPHAETVEMIELITKGAVTSRDFYDAVREKKRVFGHRDNDTKEPVFDVLQGV